MAVPCDGPRGRAAGDRSGSPWIRSPTRSPPGRRNADLALAVIRSYGIAETDDTYAVRLLSSLIHGYIALEIAGSLAHREPPSEVIWPEVLDNLDRTLEQIETAHRH